MTIISKLNDTIPTDGSMVPAPSHPGILVECEQHLRSLQQSLTFGAPTSSVAGVESSVLETAELYRIAILIFLERGCRRKPRSAPEVEDLVNTGLKILQKLKVCGVMWPLFIVACEAESDEQRTIILETFEESGKIRKAGNISVIRGLCEAVWKQDDLFTYSRAAASTVPLLRYGSVICTNDQLPSFT